MGTKPEDLNNNLILFKDINGRTAWHRTREKGKLEKLRKLWEWFQEMLTQEVLNNKLMLFKADIEYTAWQVAALMGNSQVI